MAVVDIDPATGRQIILTEAFSYNGQYEVKATGFRGTATAGTTTDLDFAVGVEDRHISGVALILKNHVDGDTIDLSVVDVDNVLGLGAGTVLKTFGIDWNVDDTISLQGRDIFNFVARIPAGIYVRISYNSTGTDDVIVKPNFMFHRKIP